jgi:hypothetical protein
MAQGSKASVSNALYLLFWPENHLCQCKVAFNITSGGSTVVEHFTRQPKVEGSRLATTAGTRGLYYKILRINEIEKMEKFSSKLVFSALSAT